MATWDVFWSDRLEIERGLSTEAVRAALARGALHDDDLIRPSGTDTAWTRVSDLPTLAEPPPPPIATATATAAATTPPPPAEDGLERLDEQENGAREDHAARSAAEELTRREVETVEYTPAPAPARDPGLGRLDLDHNLDTAETRRRVDLSSVELIRWDSPLDEPDPLDEDDEAASFTLSRGAPEKVEELDLAAMVDVAFQLVLFFLVTATTVLYKSLEVPKPNPEAAAAAATQGKAQTLNDLQNDFILVEIDPGGALSIARAPVAAALPALVERLRTARESTGRKTMLLSADAATAHRNAVLAYDAANEIGLGIAIARPAQRGE